MSTVAEAWIQEGIEKWIQLGIRQGLEQGLEQGSEEATRGNLIDVLEIRFGELPENLLSRLNGIKEIECLRQLHKEAVKTPSLKAFLKKLKLMKQVILGHICC